MSRKLGLSALQFDSILGKPSLNISKANKLLCNFFPKCHSLLVLPELAFTGYKFENPEEISPFLENRNGISVQWALDTAQSKNTHVIVGFPERGDDQKIYNTAAFVAPSGVLGFYRKTHLYQQDKIWGCSVGDGFDHTLGPFPSFPWKLQIGICMDLNPFEFTAPFMDMEFMSALKANNAQLAAIPMNWEIDEPPKPGTPDSTTVEYWQIRQMHPIPTVFANRCGIERGTLYGGSSSISTKFNDITSLSFDGEGLISRNVHL